MIPNDKFKCREGSEKELAREMLETLPATPMGIEVEFLRGGIRRPNVGDNAGVERYLDECSDAGLVPFQEALFTDETGRYTSEFVTAPLVPRGSVFQDNVLSGLTAQGTKFAETVERAILNGCPPHVIHVKTVKEGYETFRRMLDEMNEMVTVGYANVEFINNPLRPKCAGSPFLYVQSGIEVPETCLSPFYIVNEPDKKIAAAVVEWFGGLKDRYHA